MDWMNYLSQFSLAGNSGLDYAMALAWFVGLLILLKLFLVIIVARLKKLAQKTKTDFDDVLIDIFVHLKPPFYLLVALFFSVKTLIMPDIVNKVIDVLFIAIVIYEVIRAIEKIGNYLIKFYFAKQAEKDKEVDRHSQAMASIFMTIVKVVLWVVGVTVALANMGVNVTSVVASLGIGGIAIALALQNILSDLFSSFSLYLDKPFGVGDFIVVGDSKGTVEKIGMKTTRIRSIGGEQLIVSNNELTSARVQNFGRMEKRRVVFSLGVVYGTPAEKLENIPKMIGDVINSFDGVEMDRCHWQGYGDFSLNYEIVFYVGSSDYAKYMDIRQKINLDIYKLFNEEKIEFAFPTQTVFVNK